MGSRGHTQADVNYARSLEEYIHVEDDEYGMNEMFDQCQVCDVFTFRTNNEIDNKWTEDLTEEYDMIEIFDQCQVGDGFALRISNEIDNEWTADLTVAGKELAVEIDSDSDVMDTEIGCMGM
jgi:hypothetical protein